jgi:hypothetical protein
MDHKISKAARGELLEALRNRYRLASRKEKAQILDEVVALAHFWLSTPASFFRAVQVGQAEG